MANANETETAYQGSNGVWYTKPVGFASEPMDGGANGGAFAGGLQIECDAGEDIDALRVVRSTGLVVVYARPPELGARSPLGITTQSARDGAKINVAFGGTLINNVWNWQPRPVLLGLDGRLVQVQPAGIQWLVTVGYAIAPNAMTVRIGPPVRLAVSE